ncbi:cyclin-dependent kinase-like 2 isoform X2 [Harmonia axyridis]|uniref:cyclin-dependent kinase-like 2 isoform X2 n=1 Tax=Harmonia axyridis TaxID=115357 RepID=UPI001E278FC2|nr:cyclin-dependent kinase-like 2 isoform X2 [Harmonia axyridis]
MDKYEHVMLVGEGSYGVVMKCRHKELNQMVAIKKFLETEEDATIRKMALREIRMLRRLRHENLVAIIEVFRYRKRFYLVFEYLNGTILDELEKMQGGLGDEQCRERLYQIVRAISYCHSNQIIHRDVKPENVLVSTNGVVKLCDFGFARLATNTNEPLTDYVATRWYRAPELLVGDQGYGTGVDIWAIGCLFAEMMTGEPLFPGESDIDQLFLIVKMIGKPCPKHLQLMTKSSALREIKAATPQSGNTLHSNFEDWPRTTLDILISCLKMDPSQRASAEDLLRHNYFTHDNFPQIFVPALRDKVLVEYNGNPLLRKVKAEILHSTDRHDEQRVRKPSSNEPCRWKFHFTTNEPFGPTKRKQQEVYENSTDRSQRSNHKSTPKVSVNKLKEKNSVPKQTYSVDFQNGNNAAEMYMLEKSLESLARLSQKYDYQRSDSPLKELANDNKLNTFRDYTTAPSTQNLSLGQTLNYKEQLMTKKSPLYPAKTTVSQISLTGYGGGKNQFGKKDQQSLFASNTWIDSESRRTQRRESRGDFTLPNLPGATATPNKMKKKNFPEADSLQSDTVTPRLNSSKSQKSPTTKHPT